MNINAGFVLQDDLFEVQKNQNVRCLNSSNLSVFQHRSVFANKFTRQVREVKKAPHETKRKLIIFQVWGLASFNTAVMFYLQDFCLYDTTYSKRNFQVGNKSLESIQNAFHSPITP